MDDRGGVSEVPCGEDLSRSVAQPPAEWDDGRLNGTTGTALLALRAYGEETDRGIWKEQGQGKPWPVGPDQHISSTLQQRLPRVLKSAAVRQRQPHCPDR